MDVDFQVRNRSSRVLVAPVLLSDLLPLQIFRSQEMPTELASHVAAGSVDAASTSRGIINAAAPTEAAAPPTEAAAPEAQAAAEQGTEAAEAPAEDAPAEDVPDAAAEAKPMSWAQRAAGPKQ